MDAEDWLLDVFDRLVSENFFGKWVCEFKNGKIVLMRFEKTELPPREMVE